MSTQSVELSSYRDQHFKVKAQFIRLPALHAYAQCHSIEHGYNFQFTQGSRNDQDRLLKMSTTLYVGNMSFFTTEEQIHELFSRTGEIRRVVMGLDKYKKTPCGFCFLEYYLRGDAENAMRYVNGTRLDDRIVRVDWDAGFIEGRQYGRGKSGGQVRKYLGKCRCRLNNLFAADANDLHECSTDVRLLVFAFFQVTNIERIMMLAVAAMANW